jgi:hypothetical protein
MTTISEHITAVIDGKSVGDVPADIRERVERGVRVRLDRHAGHSTIHNSNGTVTVTNDRLRVTLPESEFDDRDARSGTQIGNAHSGDRTNRR